MSPTLWSMRSASAALMVAIWIAAMGEMPMPIAMRTMLSRWPRVRMSLATTSSVQKLMRRVALMPISVTILRFSVRKCEIEDSRTTTYMPFLSFSRNSSAV